MSLTDAEYKARRDAALFKFEAAATVWHNFVTLGAEQDVVTATGPIPSLRKVINQIRAEGTEVIDPALMLLASVIEESVDEASDFVPKPLP